MLGFYRKASFMDWIALGIACLRAEGGVFLHDACVWGWGFQSL